MGTLGLEHPAEHVRYRVANVQLNTWPYRHMLVRNAFPSWYYDKLLDHFPPKDLFSPLSERHQLRLKFDLAGDEDIARLDEPQRSFWSEFQELFVNESFMDSVVEKYCGAAAGRFQGRCRPMVYLFRDMTGYGIGPHPDTRTKLITMLFYLPRDDSQQQFGTSVLVPKNGSPDPGPHDKLDGWDQFHTVFTAPYLPNTLLSFYVTADSWHAVDTHAEAGERWSLQYFICVDDDNTPRSTSSSTNSNTRDPSDSLYS